MKLIFIYGPPGVGKLTVGKELARITGYNLFHNHLTVDLARSVFPFSTKESSNFVEKIRLDVFEMTAKSNLKGMIFTFVYAVEKDGKRVDDRFVKKVLYTVKKYGGKVLFVKLLCDPKILYERVQARSRRTHIKIHHVKTLKAVMANYQLGEIIPFCKSLTIDNTRLSPKKVSIMIKKHYGL